MAIYLEDITEIRNKYAMILTQKEALLLQTGGHHTQQNLNWNRHEDPAHRRVGRCIFKWRVSCQMLTLKLGWGHHTKY